MVILWYLTIRTSDVMVEMRPAPLPASYADLDHKHKYAEEVYSQGRSRMLREKIEWVIQS